MQSSILAICNLFTSSIRYDTASMHDKRREKNGLVVKELVY